jgi:cytochrome P450
MKRIPAISGPGAVRNAVEFGRDPLGFLDSLRGGGVGTVQARFVVGPTLHIALDDTLVREVLLTNHDKYHRPDILSSRTDALTRNGLIQSDGELWRAQRSRLQPLFGRDRIVAYCDAIGTVTEDVTGRWLEGRSYLDASSTGAGPGRSPGDSLRGGRDGEIQRHSGTSTAASASVRVNLYEEMVGLTARVIARTLLDREITPTETRRFIHATQTVADEFEVSPVTLLRQLLPTPPSTEYRRAIEEMHEWADGVIEEHRRAENPPDNLITRLLEAEPQATAGATGGPSGGSKSEPWAPNLIRDELLTFLFAGHETTALALCYALGFVANDPEVAERVRQEARTVLDGERPSWAHLQELEYTERVIRETLRLRPPSWAIFREAKVEAPLGDQRVREGDYVLLPQWALHRDRRYFDRPEQFDPDRWETIEPSSTPAYFPFGAGPQACIGGQMALAEAQLVLAAIVAQFDVDIDSRTFEDLRPAGVLQPRGGMPATLTPAAE